MSAACNNTQGLSNCHNTTTTTGSVTMARKTMVQEPNNLAQRFGVKRSFNNQQGATTSSSDMAVGQNVVYNNESIKRQKCQKSSENVQNEKEPLVDSSSSSPKLSCISMESLKTHLECPVCLNVPKVGPIYQCRNGHLLCKECHPRMKCCPLCQIPLEKLRNLLSEQLVSMIYPEYQFSADRSKTRDVIWKGQLHWRENPPRPGLQNPTQQQRVERSVNLSITTAMENGVHEVLPMNWPTSLVMQTIPISLINRTGKQFFSNSRTVLFHPSEEESMNSLTNLLSNGATTGGNGGTSGLAGCVHFSGVPNCDVKVLILLYSPGKKVFLGLIPNDQNTFVERIREEIRKEKSKRDILAKMNAHHAASLASVGNHVVASVGSTPQQPLSQPSLIQQQL